MSLIHKALKKAEGSDAAPSGLAEPPVETFVGAGNSLKSQLTPRTIVLLAIALLSLCFMIYKKFLKKNTVFKQTPVAAVQPQAQAPALPTAATTTQIVEMPKDEEVEEGKKLYASGKFDEALAKFLDANVKNPSNPEVYNNIGLIYKRKNDLAQAEAFYKKALGLKANYPEALNNLGVLKAAAGETLEASVYLKKAIESDSKYADAYFNLAVLNDGEGNFREAIINYKNFLLYETTKDNSLISSVKERIEELSE